MFEELVREMGGTRSALTAGAAELGDRGRSTEWEELHELLTASTAMARAAQGMQAAAMAQIARREWVRVPGEPEVVEQVRPLGQTAPDSASYLAFALDVSESMAARRLALATQLVTRHVHSLRLLSEGAIDEYKCERLVAATADVDDETARVVDEWFATRITRMEPARIAGQARRVIQRIAPQVLADRRTRSRAERDVDVAPDRDGMTSWWARLPAAVSAAMWSSVTTLAAAYRREDPTLSAGQARADALADLVLSDVEVRTSLSLGLPVIASESSAVTDVRPTFEEGPDDWYQNLGYDHLEPDLDDTAHDDTAHDDTAHDDTAHDDTAHDNTPSEGPADVNEVRTDADAFDCQGESESESEGEGQVKGRADGADGAQRWQSGSPGGGPALVKASPLPDGPLADIPDALRHSGTRASSGAMCPATLDGRHFWVSGVDVPKVGYIPPDVVATLIRELPYELTRVLLDSDTGVLLESSTRAYRPPPSMRHFVQVRDRTCRMFGCSRPAQPPGGAESDLDHAIAHPEGPTSPANLADLCRHHHRVKQHKRWRYHLSPDGVCTWTSPGGITRHTYPPDHLGGTKDPPSPPRPCRLVDGTPVPRGPARGADCPPVDDAPAPPGPAHRADSPPVDDPQADSASADSPPADSPPAPPRPSGTLDQPPTWPPDEPPF